MKKNALWSAVSLAGFALCAHAQQPALEEVVVTAQRRAEQVQDVPISVTALDEQFIADADIRTIEDLNGYVPSLYTTNSVNYGAAPISIRGIGGANGGGNFFNDEPVAVYLNDMYIGRLSFSTADLVDISSVQVLRGPQGTLFGRNATAGALLIRTARPTDELEGHFRGRIAEFGETRAAVAVSGPLGERVAGRLALGYSERDGWGDNATTGSEVNGSEDTTARLSLAVKPSESLTLDLVTEFQSQEATPGMIAVANPAPGVLTSPFIPRPDLDQVLDNREFMFNSPSDNESDAANVTFAVNWDLGDLVFDAITGYRDYDLDGRQDSDSTPFSLFNNSGSIRSEQLSQEIRVSSDTDGRVSWLGGVYYYDEEARMDFIINNFGALFAAGTNANFAAAQDLSSWAAFADATFNVTDQFSITVGGRLSTEDKDFTNNLLVFTIRDSIPLPIPFGPFMPGDVIPGGIVFSAPPTFVDDEDFDNFSPRVVFDYAFNEDVLGYFSFSQGFKSGGFNSFGLTPAFSEEEVDAFEAGVKSTLGDGRLRLNAAAFVYDYTDLQVRLPVPTGGVTIDNAGEADVSGLEVEFSFVATDRLRFNGNISLLDTELKDFQTQQVPDDLLFFVGAPIPLEAVNAEGNELTRAPEVQYYLEGQYRFNIGTAYRGLFQLGYRFQDEVFFLETNQNQVTYRSDDSEQLDLRLSFYPEGEAWEVALFGQNVTDERSITQITALGSYPNAAINEPEKYGVEFIYRWD